MSAPTWALFALNSLLSFDKGVVVPVATQQALLRLVQRAWEQAPTAQGRNLALYAARGASVAQAMAWLQSPALEEEEMVAARKVALKRLQQRL